MDNLSLMIDALLHGGGKPDEHITSSAIKHNDKIYSGITHGDALTDMVKALKVPDNKISSLPIDEGFMTNHGRYLSREEAHEFANRIKQGDGYRQYQPGWLSAEDLLPRDTVIDELTSKDKYLKPAGGTLSNTAGNLSAPGFGAPGQRLTDLW